MVSIVLALVTDLLLLPALLMIRLHRAPRPRRLTMTKQADVLNARFVLRRASLASLLGLAAILALRRV